MSFPRYECYKDSGVEWLGEVPEHWQILPLKRGYEVKLGKMLQPEPQSPSDELLPYLRAANIQWRGVDLADVKQMWFSSLEREVLKLRLGDLLISEGGDVGRSTLWNDDLPQCCFQNSVNRVRSKGTDSIRFLYYWLRVMKDKEFIDALCNKSTIAHFTAEKVGAVPVPYPPCNEQESIASVLDAETAKIDALIEKQRSLIELLKEKRQAVISHAVTKGLNTSIPLTDSGIEWLGTTPKHWRKLRLGAMFREVNDAGVDGLPILSVSIHHGVSDKQLEDEEMDRTVVRSDDQTKYKRVSAGDLVYNMMRAWQGGFGTVTVEGMVSPAYVVARPSAGYLSRFVEFILRTPCAVVEMRRYSQGVTDFRLRLYWDKFKCIQISIPPLSEQEDILSYIETKTAEFDSLTEASEQAIAILNERRTALISAAVTGKIDVRNYNAKEIA